jgi:precorrin-6B methylase 2
MKMQRGLLVWLIGWTVLGGGQAWGQEGKPRYETRAKHDPNGTGRFYLGREIAQVMGYQGMGWLERPERIKEEEPAKLIAALELKPGLVVADLGAGSGYHSFLMAPKLLPGGKVLAVDIQPEMIVAIQDRAKREQVANVETVLSAAQDPKLPAEAVDRILLVDVYHELSHPYEMTRKMIDALKPGGWLVLVEFRLEDDAVPIKLVHKMSERQALLEMAEFPELRHLRTVGTLPWQHILIFEKTARK